MYPSPQPPLCWKSWRGCEGLGNTILLFALTCQVPIGQGVGHLPQALLCGCGLDSLPWRLASVDLASGWLWLRESPVQSLCGNLGGGKRVRSGFSSLSEDQCFLPRGLSVFSCSNNHSLPFHLSIRKGGQPSWLAGTESIPRTWDLEFNTGTVLGKRIQAGHPSLRMVAGPSAASGFRSLNYVWWFPYPSSLPL